MKTEMEIVRGEGYSTRAMKPKKPLMIDERWVDRIEKISKGKIRRVSPETPRRRGRGKKVDHQQEE